MASPSSAAAPERAQTLTGPLIGGHVSTRGGIHRAVDNAVAIGAEVYQTHPTPGQTWRPLLVDEIVLQQYRDKVADAGLEGRHYLHAPYLINLASPKAALLKQSVASLVHYMELARELDAAAVVFHPGSHLGVGFDAMLPQIGAALREVVERGGSDALLLVENSAGSGGCIGCNLEEIARMVDASGSSQVGVCFDTQHAFASGYELRTDEGIQRTLDELQRLIGFEPLALVHANDSRRGLGSMVDRHANIGEGEIGVEAFTLLLRDARMRRVPWLLEVPGDGVSGPDLQNINRLRTCAGRETLAAPR
ncbi:MAG: deoxyribonuclease IV [Candidatus Dormibacteraeota bacterium]|nr:deoxyribonuclease IV [Candidatus Dormibacteraeota bacterium]MBV9525781.1 deoxyribonuclease IV [Candidatus Dormibacteraeota bacterium]